MTKPAGPTATAAAGTAEAATPSPTARGRTVQSDTLVLAALAFLSIGLGVLLFWDERVDDAFISLRYARNLLTHGQLAFNLDQPPVEGYSNLLWTLLLVPAAAAEDPMAVVRGYGLVSLTASLWLLLRIARVVAPTEQRLGPLAWCLCGASPGWVYWHFTGLETPLFGTLLLAGLYLQLRDEQTGERRAWWAWGALMLTRIDGFVLAIPAIALPWLLRPTADRLARSARTLGLALLPLAASFAFRLAYYGDPLPNTYYAKVSSVAPSASAGLAYLVEPLRQAPALGIALLAFWWARKRAYRSERLALTCAALLSIQCAYVVAVGGDWMPLYRLVAPVVPLAALGAALTLSRPLGATRSDPGGLAAIAPVVLAVILPMMGYGTYWMTDASLAVMQTDQTASIGKHLGRHLRREAGSETRVALGAAGSAAFYSKLPVIDMGGLADRHIAHRPAPRGASDMLSAGHIKGDGYYVLAERPQIIVFVAGRSETPGPYTTDTEIAFHPRFHADYERHRAVLSRPERRVGLYGGPPEPAERLLWFGQLETREKWLGLEVWQPPSVEVFYYRAIRGERSPAQEALAKVAGAFEHGQPDRALAVLEASRGLLEAAGFGHVIDPIAARLEMDRGRHEAAAAHLLAAEARLDDPWRRLLRAWVHLDPAFEPLVGAAPPDSR